ARASAKQKIALLSAEAFSLMKLSSRACGRPVQPGECLSAAVVCAPRTCVIRSPKQVFWRSSVRPVMDLQTDSVDSLKIGRWAILENFILGALTVELEQSTVSYVIEVKNRD